MGDDEAAVATMRSSSEVATWIFEETVHNKMNNWKSHPMDARQKVVH